MQIPFWKYHGTGNDFIMMDGRAADFAIRADNIQRLCDRHFGIGSDGLLVLRDAVDSDFYADFFNPDGSQSFCGNGSRCAVAFARALGMHHGEGVFTAFDGEHAFQSMDGEIAISMRPPHAIEHRQQDVIMNTGSPHFIHPVDEVESFDLMSYAHEIRYSEEFNEKGINVNVVHWRTGEVYMRTYERGVENETLSCGTGVTAAAIHFAQAHPDSEGVRVHTRGGVLRVQWQRHENNMESIWLIGPAMPVFQGMIEL